MKKKVFVLFLSLMFTGAMATGAKAATIDLYDYEYNIDGALSLPLLGDPVPVEADETLFDDLTGLGTIEVSVTGVGDHFVGLFVDHEIDELINTYFNELGSTSGAPAAGQTWEIDEPDVIFGDIIANFENSAFGVPGSDLDNAIGAGFPDDVSMALGWDFTLAAGETATIDFNLSEIAPAGFYLAHTDPDSNATVYFSSTLAIAPTGGPGPAPIPEPSTVILLGLGMAGLAATRRRWGKHLIKG